jgi:enamine deaminase RidA (YjgF/YER057c/UK114 family)
MATYEDRLNKLGLKLPTLNPAAGNYVPAVLAGNLVFISGQGPIVDGKVIYQGKVGTEVSEQDAYQAARLTGLNLLAALQAEIGSLDRVKRIVKVLGWVNSATGFNRTPAVINGVSDLMAEVFGDNGKHARSAVSSHELPFNMSVEAEMVVEIHP